LGDNVNYAFGRKGLGTTRLPKTPPRQSAIRSYTDAVLDGTKAWWISSDNPNRQANVMAMHLIFARDHWGFSVPRSLAHRNARSA
jgi:hypothetical protein